MHLQAYQEDQATQKQAAGGSKQDIVREGGRKIRSLERERNQIWSNKAENCP